MDFIVGGDGVRFLDRLLDLLADHDFFHVVGLLMELDFSCDEVRVQDCVVDLIWDRGVSHVLGLMVDLDF